MFDRHQAEITVMQFTGHSLPVHQSMSVPWDFFIFSHFIRQIPPTRFLSITGHWDVSLPSGASLSNGIFARVEGQNTTNWGDERGCNEGHWHAYTRGLPWGLPEVIGTVQQVNCNQRRLLRRWLEFHMFTINKSAHTKKV